MKFIEQQQHYITFQPVGLHQQYEKVSNLSSLFHIADEDLRVETFNSKDLMLLLLNKLHISS